MKVICIKSDSVTVKGPRNVPNGSVKEGQIYTVVESIFGMGETWYGLGEISIPFVWYAAALFIPLSSIDETEMAREYKTQTV